MRSSRGGRGAPAWQMQRQHTPRMSDGSPMNDHIGLQDIDKELELLKRKREIIEQQQQILSNEFQRNDYNQVYGNNSLNRFDDYAQLYDEYGQSNRKRPIAVWEDDIPTKRFSSPTNRSFDSLQRGGPSRFRGGDGSRSFRPARSGPVRSGPVKRDFIPSRVTKRPTPPANRLNSYPTSERKKLVTVAKEAVGCEWNRLRPDHEPSAQLNGRLELALGHIIKEIREDNKRDELNSVIKTIKKTIRERIRELMMGQLIDRVDTIIAKYRATYDKESDKDVVNNTIEQHNTKDSSLLKIDDPETYFKKNLYKITEYKLKCMVNKLEELHREESKEINPDASSESKALAKNPLDPTITSQEKYQNLDRFLTAKMTSMLKKYVPFILKIMDIDQKYMKLKSTITSETVKKLSTGDKSTAENITDVSNILAEQSNSSRQGQRHVYRPLPYYVKILGKPGLPKRKLMEAFFDEYKPVSVKKHRTMHNLLFAGFEDKESFEKLLAADGHTIGKYKLSIRVSERVNPEQKKNDPNDSVSSDDKIIGAELDAQITDLLSSIRKGEEGEAESTPEGGEVQSIENAEEKNADDTNTGNIEITNANTEVINAGENVGVKNTDGIENIDENRTEEIGNADAPDTENATEDADTKVTEQSDTIEIAAVNAKTTLDDADKNNDYPDDGVPWTSDDTEKPANGKEEDEKADQVKALASETKMAGKATPVRASSRLAATPSRIQTRRASRLMQNEN